MMRGRSLFVLSVCSVQPFFRQDSFRAAADASTDKKDDKKLDEAMSKLSDSILSAARDSVSRIDTNLLISTMNSDAMTQTAKLTHEFFESGVPGKISFGFATGFCSAYFVKKSSKIVAFTVGGMFAFVQYLSSNGYIQVNYDRLSRDFEEVFDLNKDGKIDGLDLQIAYKKIQYVLQYNLPSGSGFGAGFAMGMRF